MFDLSEDQRKRLLLWEGAKMTAQLAACICFALIQPCLGDETLFTCTGGNRHTYNAEGGYLKPGWVTEDRKGTIKLVKTKLTEKGSYDIQFTGDNAGTYSALADRCAVTDMLGMASIFNLDTATMTSLDKAFIVTCRDMISTYLFYTRSGIPQLLETHLDLPHETTSASVSMTKDCRPGD